MLYFLKYGIFLLLFFAFTALLWYTIYVFIYGNLTPGGPMETFQLTTPGIKLGQLLKVLHIVPTGGAQKDYLETHSIYVNGEPEKRRGRKLVVGDRIKIGNREIQLT